MDRHDEKRRHEHDDDTVERTGDTLGLGGAAVPKAPGDPVTEYDEESVRRRRERMSGATDETTGTNEDPDRQRSGATGIDMGAGGEGTHVSGK
jgi:hypothetical protein